MPHGQSPRHQRRNRARRRSAEPAAPSGPVGPVRLQKLIAAAGLASRRAAEELLRQGRVTVNGRTATLGDSADPGVDVVALDGERLRAERKAYWVVHKPAGVVTTLSDPEGRKTVVDLLPAGLSRLHPVGRLDRDTAGLVLLTNDGPLTHALLHPSLESEREYRVTVRGELLERNQRRIQGGIRLDDGPTAPARVEDVRFDPESDTTTFSMTLMEGRKRQIRRTLQTLGHPVRKLTRVRMGPLRLGRLGRGEARPLRGDEIKALLAHAERLRAAKSERERAPGRGGRRPRRAPAP